MHVNIISLATIYPNILYNVRLQSVNSLHMEDFVMPRVEITLTQLYESFVN